MLKLIYQVHIEDIHFFSKNSQHTYQLVIVEVNFKETKSNLILTKVGLV